MFAQPRRGRAWCGCPKPRRRGWLRKQSARGPPTAIKIRVVLTGRRRGPFVLENLLLPVKLPSGGFGPLKREDRRAAFARRSELLFSLSLRSTSTVAGWDGRRSPASNYSALPHCDFCELVCSPSAAQRLPACRNRRSPRSGPGSAPATRRRGGVPPPHEDNWLSRPDRQALWGAGDNAQLEHNPLSATDSEVRPARQVGARPAVQCRVRRNEFVAV